MVESTNLDRYLQLLRDNPAYALGCAVWGGIMPGIGYWTIHTDLKPQDFKTSDPIHWVLAATVAACLVFSIRTVYRAGYATSDERIKAVCWVIGLEGAMTCSPTQWLGLTALAVLVGINGIATACVNVKNAADAEAEPEAEAEPVRVEPPPLPVSDPIADVATVMAKVRAVRRKPRMTEATT